MTEFVQNSDPNAEARALLEAMVLGDADDSQLDRLNDLLAGDVSLRQYAARFLEEEAVLRRQFQVLDRVGDFHNLTEGSAKPAVRPAPAKGGTSLLRAKFGLGIAIAAGLALAAFFLIPRWQRDPAAPQRAPLRQVDRAILAQVVDETHDSEWSLDHESDLPQRGIRSGDIIRVARGKIRLNYTNGIELTLHGPALFEVISDMRGRALLGRLTAKITKGAEGFSVLTPRATVIDLGTELGIEVDDAGATDVVVFEGSVDLRYTSQQGGTAQQRRLFTGEAMRFDAYGTISRIVSITHQHFSDELKPSANDAVRPTIISSVRDNIQRETAWNYYEIVHAGMGEDARAFVDRQSHEWNGIDGKGMPKYLLGGDYVKTFNSDKCREDIELVVMLESPCNLYILFDDRIPAPQWLKDNFRNTGDKIGIDGGPWIYNGVASQGVMADIGPGVSIDDSMSVWVRKVQKPGPIRLGATQTPHDDLNMYGIVAVPLDEADSSSP